MKKTLLLTMICLISLTASSPVAASTSRLWSLDRSISKSIDKAVLAATTAANSAVFEAANAVNTATTAANTAVFEATNAVSAAATTANSAASADIKMVRFTRFEGQTIIGVDVSMFFDVEIIYSQSTSAIVEIPQKYEGDLTFELRDGIVFVLLNSPEINNGDESRNSGIDKERKSLKLKVYLSDLHQVTIGAFTQAEFVGKFKTTSLEVRTGDFSSIDNLYADVSGNAIFHTGSFSKADDIDIRATDLDLRTGDFSKANIEHTGDHSTICNGEFSNLVVSGNTRTANIIKGEMSTLNTKAYKILK